MSGAEAIVAVQLIDACTGITKTIFGIGRAVHDAQGLPPKLRALCDQLPMIEDLLESARETCEEGKVTEDAIKSAEPVLKQCEQVLSELRDIFRKACPKDGDDRGKRIWKGAKAVFFGRDSQLQKLLGTIQDNFKLLEQKEMYVIGDKLDALLQHTEALAQDDGGKYTHSGAGNIVANEGGTPTNYVQGGEKNRQINNPGAYHGGPATTYKTYRSRGTHPDIAFGNYHRGFQLAQNYGHVHIAPERPETPPKPSSNVPFRRDPHLVECPTLTEQFRAKLSVPAGRVALVGLGGVGKSQLAIEYARQLRQQSPQTWVLWIHASSAARFKQSVRDVADQGRGIWLLVLDNADDAGLLLEPPATTGEAQPARRRIDYIPTCDQGSVVITTRSKKEALRVVYESDIVDVLPMSEGEAEVLLESKLGQPSQDHRELVLALDCMPLAIAQAAGYIRERRPRYSVQQDCREMERSRASRTSLLLRNDPLLSQDAEAHGSVLLTWQISSEHIHETRRSAAELLSLMSFCDRLAIPEILLRVTVEEPSGSADGILDFVEDIVVLRNFSFVSHTADAQTWEMHRLVQDATLVWLEGYERLDNVRERFVYHLHTTFPTGHFENWQVCRTLFPHAKSAAEQKPVTPSALI
ncbi:hypothetical protein LTR74_016751 [Friedmanniomyces endolithicus]|nr:hypothetical protein LTR74_016751 [Friedmanniomyces endolithicus]